MKLETIIKEIERLEKLRNFYENMDKIIGEIIEEGHEDLVDILLDQRVFWGGEPFDGFYLSRIWSHVKGKERQHFGMLSAWKTSKYGKNENEKRTRMLERDVRSAGYGFVKVRGYYQDLDIKKEIAQAKRDEDWNKVKKLEDSSYEDSLYVPLIDFSVFLSLLGNWDEENGIFMDKDHAFGYYTPSGKSTQTYSNIRLPTPEQIFKAWSVLKGHRFVFESTNVARGGLTKWERMSFEIR